MRKAKRLYFLEDSRDWCSHYDRRISAEQSLDEIAMDGDREDITNIDADFREVEDIEPEEVEIIDSFAIPDEPESYESNRVRVEADSSQMTPED